MSLPEFLARVSCRWVRWIHHIKMAPDAPVLLWSVQSQDRKKTNYQQEWLIVVNNGYNHYHSQNNHHKLDDRYTSKNVNQISIIQFVGYTRLSCRHTSLCVPICHIVYQIQENDLRTMHLHSSSSRNVGRKTHVNFSQTENNSIFDNASIPTFRCIASPEIKYQKNMFESS